jgi:hypothetical protein
MTHEELRERLLELAYGELAPGEAREVEAHAASCEACRAELGAIRGTRHVMSALPAEPAPARGERILVAAAREAVRAREPRRAWPRWLWAAPVVAASLVVVVAVSLRVDAPPPPSAAHEDPNALRGEALAKAPESPPAAGAEARSPAPPEVASAPAEPRERADTAGGAKGAPVAREEAPRLAQRKAEAEARDRSSLRRHAAPPEEAPAEDLAAERFASAPAPAPSVRAEAEAEAKRAEEAPAPARRAKALALARPGTADQDHDAASGAGAGAGAGPHLREVITPRDRALAAARARAGAIGFSMAGTTVEVGAPLTWAEWRAQHAPGSDAAPPDALGARRFWPVVFLPSRPEGGGGLTVFVEDGTFRALAEVRGK